MTAPPRKPNDIARDLWDSCFDPRLHPRGAVPFTRQRFTQLVGSLIVKERRRLAREVEEVPAEADP